MKESQFKKVKEWDKLANQVALSDDEEAQRKLVSENEKSSNEEQLITYIYDKIFLELAEDIYQFISGGEYKNVGELIEDDEDFWQSMVDFFKQTEQQDLKFFAKRLSMGNEEMESRIKRIKNMDDLKKFLPSFLLYADKSVSNVGRAKRMLAMKKDMPLADEETIRKVAYNIVKVFMVEPEK